MKKFTLMELLIVIAIIGILLTLLLPSLSRAKNKARTVLCINNLRTTAIASQKFSNDNGGGIVQVYYKAPGFYYGWDLSLQKYLGDEYSSKRNAANPTPNQADAAICPAYEDLQFVYNKGASAIQQPQYSRGANGATSRHNSKYISYGINQFLSNQLMLPTGYPGNGANADGAWYTSYGKRWVYMAEIDKPGETMMFCETYDTQRLTKFQDAYFNPNHDEKLTYSRADASATTISYKTIVNDGLNTNTSNFNSLEGWEIDFWGCSVSPKF